jgi:hypothetical protein
MSTDKTLPPAKRARTTDIEQCHANSAGSADQHEAVAPANSRETSSQELAATELAVFEEANIFKLISGHL